MELRGDGCGAEAARLRADRSPVRQARRPLPASAPSRPGAVSAAARWSKLRRRQGREGAAESAIARDKSIRAALKKATATRTTAKSGCCTRSGSSEGQLASSLMAAPCAARRPPPPVAARVSGRRQGSPEDSVRAPALAPARAERPQRADHPRSADPDYLNHRRISTGSERQVR